MMGGGNATTATAIAIAANPVPSPSGPWAASFPGAMEVIPEEEADRQSDGLHSPRRQTTSPTPRTLERVRRKREVFTSEQIDTLVSTLPTKDVPAEWKDLPAEETLVSDPVMQHTYVTQLPGQTSARSSRKTYVYETHLDDPDSAALENTATYSNGDAEKYSHSTQKVTRVTKIRTTRSIKQVPVDPSNIFFDADGNPLSNGVDGTISEYDYDSAGIDLSHSCITEHEEIRGSPPLNNAAVESEVPSAPPRPEAILTDENDILLSWSPPKQHGAAGPLLGYLVEFRRGEDEPWEAAHDELLVDNECKVSKLEDSDYRFRVSAANSSGLGPPSQSSLPVAPRRTSAPPLNARVLNVDSDRVLLEWDAPQSSALRPSYLIEYRNRPTQSWRLVNEQPIARCRFEAANLRPNEDWEFRVVARYEDGALSEPSEPTGFVRTRPPPPERQPPADGHPLAGRINPSISRPGKPQVIASDLTYVRLRWAPSTSPNRTPLAYLVEVKEVDDPSTWFVVGPEPIASNEFIADNLQPDAAYAFRVTAMAADGSQSEPSPHSEVIRLNDLQQNHYSELTNVPDQSRHGLPPDRPAAPEYLDFDGGNSITLCWLPSKSVLPVLGYEVEFRDAMQDASSWYKVTDNLVRSCKTTIGYLIHSHQYQFRIIAKNANGFSEPSDPSPLITIGSLLKDTKYLEAERHAAVSLLQDEMIRESPPLPDRDDSPPPMYKQPNQSNLQWRDPTLKEVIDYLKSNDENVVLDASGYLQHLTFNNDLIKEDTRSFGGIPLLIRLLQHRNSEVVRNACGCLKNLAFGRGNDVNKKAIYADGGVKALGQVLKTTSNVHVREEATGAIWNISSSDDLKEPVFHQVAETVVQFVVVPSSGLLRNQPPEQGKHGTATVFRNGTGILRNISAASPETRKLLRSSPNLIESLLFALRTAIQRRQVDTRAVENIVCILRNLSYRVQEVVDPKYNPRAPLTSARSKSTPPFSPKSKKKSNGFFKKNKKEDSPAPAKVTGAQLLWHEDTVQLYLDVLQNSADPEILEASAAALQNLAACQFEGSMAVRAAVRELKGLPVLVELMNLRDDKVVCSVVTALRNLCIDPKNLDLVGRHAMKAFVLKLPEPGQQTRDPHVSDATIGAVLGIFWEVVRSSLELTRLLHENGGVERLRFLAKSYPMYGKRVCKYATQVLYFLWQHKEMQEIYKRAGLRDADFYSGTLGRRGRSNTPGVDYATLRRPISSQGNERPAHLRSETADESADSVRYGGFDSASPSTGRASSARFAEQSPHTPNSERSGRARNKAISPQTPNEPVYASLYKRNGHRGSVGGDSWV